MSKKNHHEPPRADATETSAAPESTVPTESPDTHVDDLTHDIQRLQAEFENYKKRVERDQDQQRQRATERLLADLIPVLDSFDLTLAHKDAGKEQLIEGITMVRDQLASALERHGLAQLPTEGTFNPTHHEAITTETTNDHPHHTILKTHQHGYTLAGKLLRPARVHVAKRRLESTDSTA